MSKKNPSTSLEKQLQDFQEKYYEKNKKATFFKNNQKFDCANEISKNFSLEELINKGLYIQDNNKIIVHYPIIKTFAHPGIYDKFLEHIDILSEKILLTQPSYDVHVDLYSFTVTAAKRYSDLIKQFCSIYLQKTDYDETINKIYIHNSPSVIDIVKTMFSPFMSNSSKDKIIVLKN